MLDRADMLNETSSLMTAHVMHGRAAKDVIEQVALADENVQRFVDGKAIRKVIVVPGRLVNVVV